MGVARNLLTGTKEEVQWGPGAEPRCGPETC